jgi:hypothetical protein
MAPRLVTVGREPYMPSLPAMSPVSKSSWKTSGQDVAPPSAALSWRIGRYRKTAAASRANALQSELAGDAPPLLPDVREPEEFVGELGHIRGALLVPLDALERHLPKLAGYLGREVVVICAPARALADPRLAEHERGAAVPAPRRR